ncbi:Alpha/Beta hydrolase protein [Aspergillus germanicus]
MATILGVGSLGAAFRGKTSDGVTQYLGIKSTPISTRVGCELEQAAIQHTLPARTNVSQSDSECLSLNVYIPAGTGPDAWLPVFVFIHGGGLAMGATSWPQSDMQRFVRLSVEMKPPIIAVSINYRLGIFGFLTSKELRSAGYKPNNGLRDQKVAMLWVQKHIRLFGGDIEAVTLVGISADAAAVTLHLKNCPGLFRRAIAMSGSYLMTQPLTLDAHEGIYEHVVQELGLPGVSPDERLKVLVTHPVEQLLSLIPPTAAAAAAFVVDGDLISSPASFSWDKENLHLNWKLPETGDRYRDLLIGNTQMDGAEFINDVVALAPVVHFAQSWPGPVHAYYFNEGNPWDGPYKGQASHLLHQAFLLQNYRELLDDGQQAVAAVFAEDVFRFCHGIRPWPVVTAIGFPVRTYGPSSSTQVPARVAASHDEATTMRRETVFEYSDRLSLDGMLRVVAKFALNAAARQTR